MRVTSSRKVSKLEYLEAFVRGYVTCAKWCGIDPEAPDPEEAREMEITVKSLREMRGDCRAFVRANWADLRTDLDGGHRTAEEQGEDFWLTRNGHGSGFWEHPGEHNQRLAALAKTYGGQMLAVYKGKLHISST